MQHHNFDPGNHEISPLIYWITWVVTFLFSKAAGFVHAVEKLLPDITMPEHSVGYFPQLNELIPAMITAGCCAIVSAIFYKIVGLVWAKCFPKEK